MYLGTPASKVTVAYVKTIRLTGIMASHIFHYFHKLMRKLACGQIVVHDI